MNRLIDNKDIVIVDFVDHLSYFVLSFSRTGPVAPGPGPSPPGAELRVVINPDTIQAQYGRSVDLICVVSGGDAQTGIYWIQDEPERVRHR